MTPVYCEVKHNPPETYGDCVRACIATLLDKSGDQVPHFYHDADAVAGLQRLTTYLASLGYAPFYSHYDGSLPLADVLNMMRENNPTVPYMLYGYTVTGPHVVVAKGDRVVHDPVWIPTGLTGPFYDHWSVMVIARA